MIAGQIMLRDRWRDRRTV